MCEKLNVSRQAVTKWEAGQAYPDIMNLIQISDMRRFTGRMKRYMNAISMVDWYSKYYFFKITSDIK
ncbi:MAG: helix-turn-helix transcriptional regulator [Lachnospiraceae bacterium]|nr:helix-turn-helix transcriptional regulator [Lachnospiraceae bacterium]